MESSTNDLVYEVKSPSSWRLPSVVSHLRPSSWVLQLVLERTMVHVFISVIITSCVGLKLFFNQANRHTWGHIYTLPEQLIIYIKNLNMPKYTNMEWNITGNCFTCNIVLWLMDCVDSSESQSVTSSRFRSAGQEEAPCWVEAEFSPGYHRRLDAPPANESSSGAVFASPFYFKYGPTSSFVHIIRVIVMQVEWLFSQTSVYLGPFVGFPCRRL